MMACKRTDLCISALLLIFNFFCSFHATDTITRTQYIFDIENSSVVSSDGNFKLGFFSPGKSQARYVGIWFNKISEHTVVWVANRGTPINNSSGVFKIGGDGNLAVFCGNEENPLWSTNVSVPKRTSIAKLLDSGNLVLVSENKWGETIIWQSFDHPTHVILPGMKHGFNRKKGLNHIITSWKSNDDPAPGEFSCGMDPHGLPQFFLYKNSVPRWRSGPWTGRIVNGLPDVATKYRGHNVVDYSNPVALISTTFVNNKDEIYITFSPKNGALFPIGVIDPTGMRQRLVWHESQKWVKLAAVPQDLCDEYDRCGANAICNEDSLARCTCLPGFESLYPQDWYIKCVETRKMEGCGKGDGEGFVRMEGVKLPDARNSTVYGNMSLEECESECLKNCNCTGFATLYVDERGLGCVAWYGELRDVRHYKDGQDFYIRVDAVDLAADARKNSKHFLPRKSTLAFIIVPVIVEMLLAALCFQYLWRKNAKTKGQKTKQKHRQRLGLDSSRSLSNHKDSRNSSGESENIELTLFELSTVITATDYFSSANKLGRGGFGPVYKGRLPNGKEIAVKRLSTNSGQGISEFKNEVLLIAKLQHRNLVKLLGYCIEKDEKILIYEFMPNKSLDYFIFDQSRKLLLDWKMRFEIILEIARGILYLHQDSRLRIIHRDLKASNILLDGEMKPKISDFGTARIFGEYETQGNTKRVVGTYGYMSPEYALGGIFSTKLDVFSFGVIVLEIISGKKCGGFLRDDPFSYLIQYTWELWSDGKALEIVDSCIVDSCSTNDILRCIHVGLLCVQDDASDRPSMSSVVFMLSNETVLPSPKKSMFAFKKSGPGSAIIERECSLNEVTITTFNAR
ncbi:hypothetical protein ACOSQ2_012585 [Xanthoceras sorbifolium]